MWELYQFSVADARHVKLIFSTNELFMESPPNKMIDGIAQS